MKTLKTLATLFLMALSFTSFASDEPGSQKLTIDYALKAYIDAFTAGKLKGFSEVLDNNARFTETRGEKILNYSRAEVMNSLRSNANIQQNCSTDFTIVDQNPSQATVKVTMKYEAFSKINLITLNNTGKGWKITNVSSSYN